VSRYVPVSLVIYLALTGTVDEFDVFMDAVNRRIAMRMMVRRRLEYARTCANFGFCRSIQPTSPTRSNTFSLPLKI
jgi:hypothetical protein